MVSLIVGEYDTGVVKEEFNRIYSNFASNTKDSVSHNKFTKELIKHGKVPIMLVQGVSSTEQQTKVYDNRQNRYLFMSTTFRFSVCMWKLSTKNSNNK